MLQALISHTLPLFAIASLLAPCDGRVFDITTFGAVGDGKVDDTMAIHRAFAAASTTLPTSLLCTVLVPYGQTFLSGPLNITRSNIVLRVDGTLEAINGENIPGGGDYIRHDWPQILPLPSYQHSEDHIGFSYLQHQAFIYGRDVDNVTITGMGTIDGSGPWWWDRFDEHNGTAVPAGRPNLIQIVNCTNLEISHVTMRDSPFWTVHPVYCANVHIHHTTIRARMYAPNVDGIDPDSCRNVMIEYNDVSVGDDHIAIKAGRCGSTPPSPPVDCRLPQYLDGEVWQTNNVTVRYNKFRIGMGIAVGSESSGSIRNVAIYDNEVGVCDFGHCNHTCCGWGPGLHIKTTPTRGGHIENIAFVNNTVYNTSMFILLELGYQADKDDVPSDYPPTKVRNISFINNQALGMAVGASFGCARGDPCEDIQVINTTIVNAGKRDPWGCDFIKSFQVKGNSPGGLEECMANSMNQTQLGGRVSSSRNSATSLY